MILNLIKVPRLFLIGLLCLLSQLSKAQFTIADTTIDFTLINPTTQYLEDKSSSLSIEQVTQSKDFRQSGKNGSFGLSASAFWFKITLDNRTPKSNYVVGVANASADTVNLYQVHTNAAGDSILSITEGKNLNGEYRNPNPIFQVEISPYWKSVFYLRIRSAKPLSIPIYISTVTTVINNIAFNNAIFGIYLGIALVMFFYNLFIYFTTRDKNYLYYIFYIVSLAFTQICLQGYIKFLDPVRYGHFVDLSIPLATSFVGIFSTLFIQHFLNLRKNMPWVQIALNTFIAVYLVTITLTFMGHLILAQNIIQVNTVVGIPIALYAGIRIQRKGFTSARFFNISWTFFLISVIIYVLKDVGVLPFNVFTNNSILLGSSIEITLLSFALADKINTYKKEKEESAAIALSISQENERIIREQNVFLEAKVNERTVELKASNEELNKTLIDLKEAESQLVESEKMASLGQLTAGIAHEINNPINFVTSNVNPLKRDVDILFDMLGQIEEVGLRDGAASEKQQIIENLKTEVDYDYLKTEIDYLLKGISEGAHRTAEIVKGLRIFSRLDEDDLKRADINEGLDSTIVIINNLLNNRIEVEKHYGEIPLVECYPGKLNQVFLNMMTNAIHAINKKWGDAAGGKMTITTYESGSNVYISIKDNGTGMDEHTKKKLFEPFFTTKDVGEGTGLGLSIAYNTIKKHNGNVEVDAIMGEGTEFIIELPINH